MLLLLLWALHVTAYSPEETYFQFLSLEGRQADPCMKFPWRQDMDGNKAVQHCESRPDPAVTVLVPSIASTYTVPSPLTLTVMGRYLTSAPTPVTAATSFVALTYPGGNCASVGAPNGVDLSGVDSLGAVVVSRVAVKSVLADRFTFDFPDSWRSNVRELEAKPRALCIVTPADPTLTTYYYIGLKIGVVFHCNPSQQLFCPPNIPNIVPYLSLNLSQGLQRQARTTCCLSALGTVLPAVGQCIFTRTDVVGPARCCGGAQYFTATEMCCDAVSDVVRFRDQPCPCTSSARCPAEDPICCLPTKYTELIQPGIDVGECYDAAHHRCCNTGKRYDPGSDQCCSINGVQSNNVPCPCQGDNDCLGGNPEKRTNLRCCLQVNNSQPWEPTQCNAYTNFPSGTSPYQAQRCKGTCFDTTYQICCNGVACVKAYEKCCNSTCCNRFTQTCEKSLREGASGSNRVNWVDFLVYYEVCSEVEQMSPHRALWLFVYPCLWLATTLFSTGLTLVFANKAASRSFAAIEQAMITLAVVTILLVIILFFCPAYKYAFVVIFVQLFTILTAAARIKKLNIVCVALQVVLLIYLFDPFHGNQYFTLASSRLTTNEPDRETAGIIHTIGKMYRSADSVATEHWCPAYYLGHGILDESLRDTDRFDNPNIKHFAYCSRGFVALLLYFASLVMLCVLVEFILTLLALLVRFTKPAVKLVVREEYDSGEDFPVY